MEFENLLNPISNTELKRRWQAVRLEMDARGIDALILQNSNDYLGGYVRWFTDLPATNGSPCTVIFPRDDLMVVVQQGGRGVVQNFAPDEQVNRGAAKRIFSPSYPSVHYTRLYDADCVVDELRRRGWRTIGLVGTAAMYYEFGTRLKDAMSGAATFVDATDIVDGFKAIKSPEEIDLIRKTAAMQDRIMERVLNEIKPGMRDFEVTALAQYAGHLMGSEQGTFNGASAPLGRPSSVMYHRHEQGRTLRQGDHLNLLVENNGPGGFYTEMSRTIVFGKASNELRYALELCKQAQKVTLENLRPGVPCRDAFHKYNEFITARGAPPEKRLFAHSQGYDLVERPLIRDDETMTVEAGMNFAVHPVYATSNVFLILCDNFLIHAEGPPEPLHKTERKIFEL